MSGPAGRRSATYLAFVATILIGGSNFIAVSYSNMELPPVFGAMLRFAIAAVLFWLIALAGRIPRENARSVRGAALYGLLAFGVSYALLYYALVGLPAGTVAVILAAVPLFTLGIAAAFGQERLSLRGLVGGFVAVAGMAVLSRGAIGADVPFSYVAAAVVATISTAGSAVVARGFRSVHPVNMNAIGMSAGVLLLVPASLLLREQWLIPRGTPTVVALAWLILLGSIGLFQLFLYVVKRWTASAAIYSITGMPVVAAALGAAMLGQPITAELLIGGLMVLTAVYVGAVQPVR